MTGLIVVAVLVLAAGIGIWINEAPEQEDEE